MLTRPPTAEPYGPPPPPPAPSIGPPHGPPPPPGHGPPPPHHHHGWHPKPLHHFFGPGGFLGPHVMAKGAIAVAIIASVAHASGGMAHLLFKMAHVALLGMILVAAHVVFNRHRHGPHHHHHHRHPYWHRHHGPGPRPFPGWCRYGPHNRHHWDSTYSPMPYPFTDGHHPDFVPPEQETEADPGTRSSPPLEQEDTRDDFPMAPKNTGGSSPKSHHHCGPFDDHREPPPPFSCYGPHPAGHPPRCPFGRMFGPLPPAPAPAPAPPPGRWLMGGRPPFPPLQDRRHGTVPEDRHPAAGVGPNPTTGPDDPFTTGYPPSPFHHPHHHGPPPPPAGFHHHHHHHPAAEAGPMGPPPEDRMEGFAGPRAPVRGGGPSYPFAHPPHHHVSSGPMNCPTSHQPHFGAGPPPRGGRHFHPSYYNWAWGF